MPARPAPFPDLKTGSSSIGHELLRMFPRTPRRKIKAMPAKGSRIIAVQMARSCDPACASCQSWPRLSGLGSIAVLTREIHLERPLGECHFSITQSYLQLSSSSFDGSSHRRLESNENFGLTSNPANVEPVNINCEAPSGQILSSDHIGRKSPSPCYQAQCRWPFQPLAFRK